MKKPEDKIADIGEHIREANSLVNIMIAAEENVSNPNEKMLDGLWILTQKLEFTINLVEDFVI